MIKPRITADFSWYEIDGLCGMTFLTYVFLKPVNYSEATFCKESDIDFHNPGSKPECPRCITRASNHAWQAVKNPQLAVGSRL